jgi:hypothetical protein
MQPSQLNTISVPAAPATGNLTPPSLYTAASVPIRVVINNIGGSLIFLAHDQSTLENLPVVANAYQLKADKDVTLVLAPGQSVYAASVGAGGTVSIAASEALPVG